MGIFLSLFKPGTRHAQFVHAQKTNQALAIQSLVFGLVLFPETIPENFF